MQITTNYSMIYLLMLLFCFSSCQFVEKDNTEKIQALSINDTLKANRIVSLENKTELLNPLRILNVNDRYLVISELKSNDFLQVFGLPDIKFLYTWGTQGRGPDEFPKPPVYLDVRGNELIVYEGLLRQLRFYNLSDTSLIKTQSLLLTYTGQMDPLNRIRRMNDSLYFADYGLSTEQTDSEHIALRPGKRKPLFTFGNYPDTELEGFSRYQEYMKENLAKPDGSKFVASYFNYNMFKIYNSNGKELKVIKISDPRISEKVEKTTDDFLYRSTGWASNEYIYFLGINGENEKIYSDPDPSFRTFLEIWDWDGNPVYRAIFDRPVHNFTVSEKHGRLYAFSTLFPQEIYEYSLPEIINSID